LIRKVEKIKENGNEALKNGKLDEAIKEYTEGLEVDKNNNRMNAILYSNRALCYIK